MKSPLLSVIVVTHNHGAFIQECLDSVLSQQTSFPFEVLVGEDGSTDGTREIVAAYASRHPEVLRAFHRERNLGLRDNWQGLLDAAQGPFLAHLDGDDLWRPGKLQRTVDVLLANPELAMVFHNMQVFDSASRRPLYLFTPAGSPAVRSLDDLVRFGTVYCHSAKVYRRDSLPEGGLDPRTRYVMDWLLHMQGTRTGGIGYLDAVLGDYRKHAGGTTAGTGKALDIYYEEELYTIDWARRNGATPDAIAVGEARVHFRMALRFLDQGQDNLFAEAISRSLRAARLGSTQSLLSALAGWPAAARLAAKAYRQLVVAPRQRATLNAVGGRA